MNKVIIIIIIVIMLARHDVGLFPSGAAPQRAVRDRLPRRDPEPGRPPPRLPVGHAGRDGRRPRAGRPGGVHHGRGGGRRGRRPAVHQRDGRADGLPRACGSTAHRAMITSGTSVS